MSETPKMERAEVKTEWEKPQDNPLENMSQDDIKKLLEYRSELLMDLSHAYIELTKTIMRLPIHIIFRQHAFFHLDQAEMWAKKGIDNVWDLPNKHEIVTPLQSVESGKCVVTSVEVATEESA